MAMSRSSSTRAFSIRSWMRSRSSGDRSASGARGTGRRLVLTRGPPSSRGFYNRIRVLAAERRSPPYSGTVCLHIATIVACVPVAAIFRAPPPCRVMSGSGAVRRLGFRRRSARSGGTLRDGLLVGALLGGLVGRLLGGRRRLRARRRHVHVAGELR